MLRLQLFKWMSKQGGTWREVSKRWHLRAEPKCQKAHTVCNSIRLDGVKHPLAYVTGLGFTLMGNPSNSYFWLTRWVKELQSQIETFQTDFQVCMYGGSRDKWTKILANLTD